MVTYSDGGGGGVAIDGLTTAKSYYVVKAVSPKIKLASSYANAMAATPDVVALTTKAAAAGNSHTLTYEKTVDTTNNKIYLRANTYDALYTGDRVTYSDGGGTAINGLTTATDYYAVKTATSPYIQLASTYANAIAASPTIITLSAGGAGSTHTLSRRSAHSGYSLVDDAGNPTERGHLGWPQGYEWVIQFDSVADDPVPGFTVIDDNLAFGAGTSGSIISRTLEVGKAGPDPDRMDFTVRNFADNVLEIDEWGNLKVSGSGSWGGMRKTS